MVIKPHLFSLNYLEIKSRYYSTWMRIPSSKMDSCVHTDTENKWKEETTSKAHLSLEQLKLRYLFLEKYSLSKIYLVYSGNIFRY